MSPKRSSSQNAPSHLAESSRVASTSLDRRHWGTAVLAALACGLSAFLGLGAYYGEEIPGCGATSECGNVLSTRWSRSFGIPVAWLGALLYGASAYLSAIATPQRESWLAKNRERCIATLIVSIGLAAAWFFALQFLHLGVWCRYCVAIHSLGILCALLMLRRLMREDRRAAPSALARGAIVAATGLVVLVVGQVLGPAPSTHRVASYSYGKGQVRITSEEAPILGNPQAPYVALELFDYTCETCRGMKPMLEVARQRYGDQLAIVLVPSPINRRCNPFVLPQVADHENACEYARIAAAVWLADAEKFSEFHEGLFAGATICTLDEAEARAVALVGREAYDAHTRDPKIAQLLARAAELYRGLGQGVMPKLLIGDVVIHGKPRSQDVLHAALEEHFGLKPLNSDAALDQTSQRSAPIGPPPLSPPTTGPPPSPP